MLNLDEFQKTIKTHQITLNGKTYTAKPLTLKKLMEIQEVYNTADEGDLSAVKKLFEEVGYPSDELLELPLQAIAKVQEELFLSIQGQMELPQKGKKKS